MDGVIEVQGGRIRGVRRRDLWSFSGVPYAASPAGPGRWRPPAPPEPWTGVLECDHFTPIAPQSPGLVEMSLGGEPEEHSEDCLSLNVWTPGLDGSRRPVMVWVHGGSFVSGSGAGSLYRGGTLAADGDVVVVTINYRLGLLGFLAHPALEDEGQSWLGGAPWSGFGNWGLADQVAALRWVHDHIAAFGGDPGNVTLFGESAGGMSVSALLAVPAARGLFHRAIVESGPPYSYTAEEAAGRAEAVAAHLGVPLTRAALERVPADALVRAAGELSQISANNDDSGLLLMPVVDGGLLPVAPEVAVATGSASEVPLLIGTTRDESAFFTVGNPALAQLDDAGLRRWTRRLTPDPVESERVIATIRGARAARGEPVSPRDLWVAIATEFIFRLPSVRLADVHAAVASPGVGTHCYLFTWESPAFGGFLGSCHALEIPFVFGTVHNPAIQGFCGGGDEAFELSDIMRRAWTSFARTGSPGEPAEWPVWDAGRRPTTVLGPWAGTDGLRHTVERPRDEELVVLSSVVPPPITG
jgi:para-nitrobenzyl esterase